MKPLLSTILCLIYFNLFQVSVALAQEHKAYVYFFLEEECPMCQYYSLDIIKIYEKYKDQGVAFKGVFPFPNTTQEGIEAFSQKYKIPFALQADKDQVLTRLFGMRVTPEVVLTDEAGIVKYKGRIDNAYDRPGRRRRVVTTHELTDALDALLMGEEIQIPETQAVGCFITMKKTNP